ncbi:MAG: hypothetical protein RMJ35_02715, partial [Phycisphaerales bacterium]|nr:hypothetical protein [Phycisphaerales bacterium]
PLTALEFREDQSVQVELAVEPQELERRLGGRPTVPLQPLLRGEARVSVDQPASAGVVIPLRRPAWVDQAISATADAPSAGLALKTARQAELAAQDRLREAILRLELEPGRSIAELTRTDSRWERVVSRLVSEAQVDRVEYFPDGSTRVSVTLDGQRIWRELSQAGIQPFQRGK